MIFAQQIIFRINIIYVFILKLRRLIKQVLEMVEQVLVVVRQAALQVVVQTVVH